MACSSKSVKLKKCKVCGKEFLPHNTIQNTCSARCEIIKKDKKQNKKNVSNEIQRATKFIKKAKKRKAYGSYKADYYKYYGLDKCDTLYCAVCKKPAVNLHHIIYASQGGTGHPTNLIPLCFECHDGHHTSNNPTTEQLKQLKKSDLNNER